MSNQQKQPDLHSIHALLVIEENIRDYIKLVDYEHALSDNVKAEMTRSLVQFVQRATNKFIAGQKSHGGDIRDKNLREEIYQEQLDLFWYTEASVFWSKQ